VKLSDEELVQLLEMAKKATPRPWFVRHLDDTHAMNFIGISTVADAARADRWPEFDHGEIVAATLVQEPRYVAVADGKWDENAAYIAAAADALPSLIEELLAFRKKVSS